LAIDDTPANLLTLGAALAHDFDLQIATSGPMGLALAEQSPPDLILLDIMMPEMDGFEVCGVLKTHPDLCHIPVIFVTALGELESEEKGLALGAADYITKPINVQIARQRIRNLLHREQLRLEVQAQKDLLDAQVIELKNSEAKLQLAASVFTYAREAIMITTANGSIVDVNKAFEYITGYSREEVLGKNPRLLSSGRQEPAFFASMWNNLVEKGHWYGEVWNRRKSGEVFAVMQTISSVRDRHGRAEHFVSLFSDITASKTHQQELEHIAHYDALTGLPNRALLADRLRQALYQSQRRKQMLAVVFLDLDGFKAINDSHGHEAGDHLLIALATRMKQALRDGDTLARIGGDEFVAVLVDLQDVATCVPLLTRLLAAAAQPVELGGATLQVSASLGVTFTPQADDVDADQLLRQADQAMYQAKLAGKNRYHVFDAELDRSVRGHHESLDHIRHALKEHQFVLHYQPKVDMRSGQVIGAEALIRWQHPQNGLLLPALFLPAIENHALSIEVGEWVIDTVLSQIEQWRTVGLDMVVSINVGARQLQQATFIDRLRTALESHPTVAPSCIELEVLETSALEDMTGASTAIRACKDMGVMFALDDFGTGYSSLTYLKRLPVGLLKIDQSFVRDMLTDADDLAILEGVIGMAAAFRRSVIAEGVETIEHGTKLLQLGCHWAQGYGIARPMPPEALPEWVRNWKPDAAWSEFKLQSDAPTLPDT
jgi:diguanylate cyclase (GGDEF)-like protein/PAS domain S-box-containing protein